MVDLPDVNVWLSLGVADHVHHARALAYWKREAASDTAFCRTTALALLRLVTNPRVVGAAALSAAQAWHALEGWLALPSVAMMLEPLGVDELLRHWTQSLALRGGDWTDAYLAAFAVAGDCRLVSFDRGFGCFDGLRWLHLAP